MSCKLMPPKTIYRYIVLYIHHSGKGYKEFSAQNPIKGNTSELEEIAKKIEHLDRVKDVYITRIVLDT